MASRLQGRAVAPGTVAWGAPALWGLTAAQVPAAEPALPAERGPAMVERARSGRAWRRRCRRSGSGRSSCFASRHVPHALRALASPDVLVDEPTTLAARTLAPLRNGHKGTLGRVPHRLADLRSGARSLRQRSQIRRQIGELLAFDGLQLDPLLLGLVFHRAAVVPHRGNQRAGRTHDARGREIAGYVTALAADRMARDAALGLKHVLAAGAVSRGRVEVMRGVEMGNDVGHLLPGKTGDLDAALLHPCPHRGPVVPHEAGELREADVMGPTELRADTALSADGVAGRALLVAEQL